MTRIDGAAIQRRVESIAEALRGDVEGCGPVTLTRLETLIDDLRAGLFDAPAAGGVNDA